LKYFGKPCPPSEPLGLPSVTLSHAVANSFLRDALTTKQLRIEIWIQEKGGFKWKLNKEASPGNLSQVEDLLFGAGSGSGGGADLLANPMIMAIRLKGNEKEGNRVGVAFADTSQFELGVSEFNDTDLYSNTEVRSSLSLFTHVFRKNKRADVFLLTVFVDSTWSERSIAHSRGQDQLVRSSENQTIDREV